MEEVSLSQGFGEVLGWLGRGNSRVACIESRHLRGYPGFFLPEAGRRGFGGLMQDCSEGRVLLT